MFDKTYKYNIITGKQLTLTSVMPNNHMHGYIYYWTLYYTEACMWCISIDMQCYH